MISQSSLSRSPRFFWRRLSLFSVAFLLSCWLPTAQAQPAGPRSVWNIAERGAFVMSSLHDDHDIYWFGTEDKGVWRYDPRLPVAKAWHQFTTKDGLGDDNAYAIAEDYQGRIWVGTQSHGVSVWNGRAWHNYDVDSGPLGERVFKIVVSPFDQSVWIATNRGISIYDTQKNSWRYQGRFTGLPSDQIQALAFASDGTVFVGTQCDGLAIGSPKDDYSKWQTVNGPGDMPVYAAGSGLPSDVINDVLVTQDGTVYVATGYGLARSDDNGRSWAYLRGKDWKAKLEGLTFPPPIPPQPLVDTLTEDYVTSLAEDAAGNIWLGHPTKGVEVRTAGAKSALGGGVVKAPDEKQQEERRKKFEQQMQEAIARGETPKLRRDAQGRPIGVILPVKVPDLSAQEKTDYVTSILPIEGEAPLVCGAGSGVVQLGERLATLPSRFRDTQASSTSAALPLPAPAPSTEQLKTLTQQVESLKTSLYGYRAAVLDADWKTKGDWVGRYGTRYAWLCAMNAPLDHSVINDPSYLAQGRLGLHPYKDGKSYEEQGLRHWLHRTRWDDPRVLYDPLIGYRRQADIDDNGESYSMNYEGPDMWIGVRVPEGTQRVSLYFFNKDGHDGNNRVRDYLIDVKRGSEDLLRSEASPLLARARVHDFWGGVYKSFLVQGPGDYYFIVRKNNSFNTVLQAVLIDKLNGPDTSHEDRRDVWLGDVTYEAPAVEQQRQLEVAARDAANPDFKARLAAALVLWHTLDSATDKNGNEDYQSVGRLLAYRALQDVVGNTPQGQELLQSWRWKVPLWTPTDRQGFDDSMKQAWQSVGKAHPYLLARKN